MFEWIFRFSDREILWPVTFLYREKFVIVASSRPPILFVSARFYCTKLNFTFVTYIYFTVRETSIKMQWKFVSNVVCLIAEFSSFFASCNMPFRITEMLFPSIYYFFYFIIVLFYTPFFLFFFSLFFSSLKFPHSYNSTRFSRDRIAAEQGLRKNKFQLWKHPRIVYI